MLQVTFLTPTEINERARNELDLALAAPNDAAPPETKVVEYFRNLAEFVVVREG